MVGGGVAAFLSVVCGVRGPRLCGYNGGCYGGSDVSLQDDAASTLRGVGLVTTRMKVLIGSCRAGGDGSRGRLIPR
jgi:hypothetical protein